MVEKRASSGGGDGTYRSTSNTYYTSESYSNAANTPYKERVEDHKPLNISSGAVEP